MSPERRSPSKLRGALRWQGTRPKYLQQFSKCPLNVTQCAPAAAPGMATSQYLADGAGVGGERATVEAGDLTPAMDIFSAGKA